MAVATAPTPSYVAPISIYETLNATAFSNGLPTTFVERDKDGTSRTFSLYSSTYVFRLAGLVDRNGNTVTYTRNGLGFLTKVTDVHGRYINIAYNNNMVATLSDSGGRTVSYSYNALGQKVSENGPLGVTNYAYNAAGQLAQIKYPNGSIHEYTYDGNFRVPTEDERMFILLVRRLLRGAAERCGDVKADAVPM